MKIYFIRHGQSVGNAEGWITGQLDPPLTEKGVAQARLAANDIAGKNVNFATIFCSSLQRAQQTAIIVADSLTYEVNIKYDDVLNEINVGKYAGKLKSEFESIPRAELIAGGAETMSAFKQRVSSAMQRVISLPQPVLLVGHNGFARCMRLLFDPSVSYEDIEDVPQHENAKLYVFDLDIST